MGCLQRTLVRYLLRRFSCGGRRIESSSMPPCPSTALCVLRRDLTTGAGSDAEAPSTPPSLPPWQGEDGASREGTPSILAQLLSRPEGMQDDGDSRHRGGLAASALAAAPPTPFLVVAEARRRRTARAADPSRDTQSEVHLRQSPTGPLPLLPPLSTRGGQGRHEVPESTRDTEDYIPLLFREDFMRSWRHPRKPLAINELHHHQRPTSETALADGGGGGGAEKGGDGARGEDIVERTATMAAEETAEAAEETAEAESIDGDPSRSPTEVRVAHREDEVVRDDGGRVLYTVAKLATTSAVILDPVQWLAQSPDAPLMEQEALFANIGPAARELAFTEAAQGPSDDSAEEEKRHHERSEKAVSSERGTDEGAALWLEKLATPPPTAQEDIGEVAPTGSDLLTPSPNTLPPPRSSPKMRAEASSRLVYNVFTHRIAKESSPGVQSLSLIGIHVQDTTRELALTDPDALNDFASKLRSRQVTWPRFWSHTALYRQLERLLSDERVTDPAERIAELLAAQYRRLHGRHRVGVVAGTGGGEPDDSGGERPSTTLIQAADDRLFSLADLNEEQTRVVELVLKGYNTYIGGSAGTGKSVLLRVIRQVLGKEGLTVAVTGLTGVAATLIGGCTLHHCFGINVHGEFTRPKELAAYDVIIIDEVSMLPRELFEALERRLRRANGVDLPFGGVQVILCGDFLQLGAIAAQPIVNTAVFRQNFVMLKLQTPVRQATNPVFTEQLRCLRRGHVPPGLRESLNFITAPDALVKQLDTGMSTRQQQQLRSALGDDEVARLTRTGDEAAEVEEEREATPSSTYVDGAVNLLPTNEEVYHANERELAKLPGEATIFMPQFLAPGLNGLWSPTYLLRIHNAKLIESRRLGLELELFLGNYFKKTEAGQAWLHGSMEQKHLVMYPLFVDALALRVRLPPDFTNADFQRFTAYMDKELDGFLEALGLGVRVREVLASSAGLQTEQDEYVLSQYAQAAAMARPVALKPGARVMLRANLAPGLVNGSLGTVVGFRALSLENLPRHLLGNPQREEAVSSYMDFLQYEQGFQTPLVPEVDFGGGRVEPIPPTLFHVGGLPNTHHYSLGIVALPLSLAYAFTVHKVQGLTLVGRVHLELSRMWPCEHLLYVAMSRVRNPEQLSISSFHNGLVKAAADCLVYDDALPTVDKVKVPSHLVPATWHRAPNRRKRSLRRQELAKLASQKRKERKEAQARRQGRLEEEIQALQEQLLAAAVKGGQPT